MSMIVGDGTFKWQPHHLDDVYGEIPSSESEINIHIFNNAFFVSKIFLFGKPNNLQLSTIMTIPLDLF